MGSISNFTRDLLIFALSFSQHVMTFLKKNVKISVEEGNIGGGRWGFFQVSIPHVVRGGIPQSDLDWEGWGDHSLDRLESIFKKALIESGPQRRFVKNEEPPAVSK